MQDKEEQNRKGRLNYRQKELIAHSVFATACELNSPDIVCNRRCPVISPPPAAPAAQSAHSVVIGCKLQC